MARAIDAIELQRRMCALCNQNYSDEPCEPSDCVFIRAINEMPTLTPPNEPLTIEELREMDGEPVWVKVFGPTDIRCDGWCEVEVRDKNTSDEIAYVWWAGSEVEDMGRTEDYGKTWVVYRRPPEGEA